MQFLIVDDSSTMRRILAQTLARLGYTDTIEAAGGQEALDCLSKTPIDLILVDWNMPGMSGLEFLRSVRSSTATRNIPVLMVTANAASADIVRAMHNGVNGYVVKPFRIETIRKQLDTLLASRADM